MRIIDMNFISQNIAPKNAKQIIVFDQNNEQIAMLPLGNLSSKSIGDKIYSFGALADIHLPYSSVQASGDFQKALEYYNNVEPVNFICISGDMSDTGAEAEWVDFKNHVDLYSPNVSVHIAAGNHDASQGLTYEYPMTYTGHPLYYSFTRGDDVFIMFGMSSWGSTPFTDESLQWLYDTLEANIDKRCFVFQHMMRLDGCGNAHGLYEWDGLDNKNGKVFISLMEHYKNVIWFHGHSHTPFKLQTVQPTPIANYDRLFGCHSVHIPSLASPRYGNSDTIADAEGYIVDVYENGIHLRGIDFIESEFLAIASYWIDTTPSKVEPGTYFDSSGTIMMPGQTLPDDSELLQGNITDDITWYENMRLSSSDGGYREQANVMSSGDIEVEPGDVITVYGITTISNGYLYINGYNDGIFVFNVALSNVGSNPADSSTMYAEMDSDNVLTIQIKEDTNINSIRFSYTVATQQQPVQVYRNEIVNDNESIVIPEGSELYINKRYSQSAGGLTDTLGHFALIIPIDDQMNYILSMNNMPDSSLSTTNTTLYMLDSDKANAGIFHGSNAIISMTEGVFISDNRKLVTVEIPAVTGKEYLALTISVIVGSTITEDDLKDIVITLEVNQ